MVQQPGAPLDDHGPNWETQGPWLGRWVSFPLPGSRTGRSPKHTHTYNHIYSYIYSHIYIYILIFICIYIIYNIFIYIYIWIMDIVYNMSITMPYGSFDMEESCRWSVLRHLNMTWREPSSGASICTPPEALLFWRFVQVRRGMFMVSCVYILAWLQTP